MQPADAAAIVERRIRELGTRPLVAAIDGPSAAGTSTLGKLLAARLDATLISGDDFYRDLDEATRWALRPEEGVHLYFDWQRLRDQVLVPLRAGKSVRYQPFSWLATGGLSEIPVVLTATPIVILEGVYAARPELADLVDVSVLVQTPAPERHRRLVERAHGNDQWWSRWDTAEQLYFSAIRPPESFDLVVTGY